jgi:hypothetical protein
MIQIVYTYHNQSLDSLFDFLISWFIRQASKVFTDLYPQHSWLLHDEKRKRLDVVCRRPGGQNKVNIVHKRGETKMWRLSKPAAAIFNMDSNVGCYRAACFSLQFRRHTPRLQAGGYRQNHGMDVPTTHVDSTTGSPGAATICYHNNTVWEALRRPRGDGSLVSSSFSSRSAPGSSQKLSLGQQLCRKPSS